MDDIELVVIGYFDGYVRGDIISDKAEIERILAGPHQLDVTRIRARERTIVINATIDTKP